MKKSELRNIIKEVLNEHDLKRSEYQTVNLLNYKIINAGHKLNKSLNEYDEVDNPKYLDEAIDTINSIRPVLDKLEKVFLKFKKEHK